MGKSWRALERATERHRSRCRVCKIVARRGADARGPCDVLRYLREAAQRAQLRSAASRERRAR